MNIGLIMRHRVLLRGALAAVVLGAIAYGLSQRGEIDGASIEAWLGDFGPWAPVIFIAAYMIAAVLFMPGSILTLAGGAMFGPLWGSIYSLGGATAGALLAFLVARYLFADWLRARGGKHYRRVIEGVDQEGWRFVAMTRLLPFVPYNLLNYALGLSRISAREYTLTSALCMAPASIGYVWLGHAGRQAIAGEGNWVEIGLFALGALALVVFLPRFIKRFRRSGQNNTPVT